MYVEILAVSEEKLAAQKWLRYQFGGQCGHIFKQNKCFLDGYGPCFLHGTVCQAPQKAVDVASGGLACQAFSNARVQNGTTPCTGEPTKHPKFHSALVEFPEYLRQRRPKCWWIEEVLTFLKRLAALKGLSPYEVFCESVRGLGYAIKGFYGHHGIWINAARSRVFVVGCLPEAGHAAGCACIYDYVSHAQDIRKLAAPTKLEDVIDFEGEDEVFWRSRMEELSVILCYIILHRSGSAF